MVHLIKPKFSKLQSLDLRYVKLSTPGFSDWPVVHGIP